MKSIENWRYHIVSQSPKMMMYVSGYRDWKYWITMHQTWLDMWIQIMQAYLVWRVMAVIFSCNDLFPLHFLRFLVNVLNSITELSKFFKNLCSTVLREEHFLNLEENIPIILCKLECIFPPAFFDVMEHLMVHLPYEARMGGPVHYRWMYPFERYLTLFCSIICFIL